LCCFHCLHKGCSSFMTMGFHFLWLGSGQWNRLQGRGTFHIVKLTNLSWPR
jgi:hypothetical protein